MNGAWWILWGVLILLGFVATTNLLALAVAFMWELRPGERHRQSLRRIRALELELGLRERDIEDVPTNYAQVFHRYGLSESALARLPKEDWS